MDKGSEEGDLVAEWEARLRSEGMPAELEVKRLRLPSHLRVKGRDPQPRREVSYAEWEDGVWSVLLPDTEMEAMLQPGDTPSVEAETRKVDRIYDAVLAMGLDHAEVLELMTQGLGPQGIAETLGIRMTDARSMIDDIRRTVRGLFATDRDPDL